MKSEADAVCPSNRDAMQIQNPNSTTYLYSKSREQDGVTPDKKESGDESIEIAYYVDGSYENNERRSNWKADKR